MRESPSVHIMSELKKLGAEVEYSDPHVPVFPKMREYSFDLRSVDLNPEALSSYDCVLIATDHDKFNYHEILENSKIVVDSRGRYLEKDAKVIKA
ncbi:UDP binding domain-containing protein [Chromohalobacter canadensis]|nr:UDP binding domain-containing protein [Chromohalobacter canadensis]